MSSINDVLKEKFGVNGSNIAETLSKITPGGGSGSGSGPLVVHVVSDAENVWILDKTAREILQSEGNVLFIAYQEGEDDDHQVVRRYSYGRLLLMTTSPTLYLLKIDISGDQNEFYANTLDDYPAIMPDDVASDLH